MLTVAAAVAVAGAMVVVTKGTAVVAVSPR